MKKVKKRIKSKETKPKENPNKKWKCEILLLVKKPSFNYT